MGQELRKGRMPGPAGHVILLLLLLLYHSLLSYHHGY